MCCMWLSGNTGCKKSPSRHHRTILSGCIFATKACIDNRKKIVKQQYLSRMSSQYGELRPTSSCDWLVGLGHPSKFQRVSHLGRITARRSSSGHQPNFAVLNRGRQLYLTGRPSRWASAHISSHFCFVPLLAVCLPSFHHVTLVVELQRQLATKMLL